MADLHISLCNYYYYPNQWISGHLCIIHSNCSIVQRPVGDLLYSTIPYHNRFRFCIRFAQTLNGSIKPADQKGRKVREGKESVSVMVLSIPRSQTPETPIMDRYIAEAEWVHMYVYSKANLVGRAPLRKMQRRTMVCDGLRDPRRPSK
jgi:hypothetical protein